MDIAKTIRRCDPARNIIHVNAERTQISTVIDILDGGRSGKAVPHTVYRSLHFDAIMCFLSSADINGGNMPKVGKKHFSYSSAGKKKAATYAKKTGKKMTNTRKKRKY